MNIYFIKVTDVTEERTSYQSLEGIHNDGTELEFVDVITVGHVVTLYGIKTSWKQEEDNFAKEFKQAKYLAKEYPMLDVVPPQSIRKAVKFEDAAELARFEIDLDKSLSKDTLAVGVRRGMSVITNYFQSGSLDITAPVKTNSKGPSLRGYADSIETYYMLDHLQNSEEARDLFEMFSEEEKEIK